MALQRYAQYTRRIQPVGGEETSALLNTVRRSHLGAGEYISSVLRQLLPFMQNVGHPPLIVITTNNCEYPLLYLIASPSPTGFCLSSKSKDTHSITLNFVRGPPLVFQ